jgi:hypothetical protein
MRPDESAHSFTASKPDRLDGVALITAERQRQVTAEGWTPEHDDTHTHFELAKAGAAYALYGGFGKMGSLDIRDLVWPWEPEGFKPSRDRVRDLAKAGALIAAEIDRLQRAAVA